MGGRKRGPIMSGKNVCVCLYMYIYIYMKERA